MLTTKQAATLLGISPRRVGALIAAGRLHAVKVGRDWLIRPADLDAVRVRPAGRPRKDAAHGAPAAMRSASRINSSASSP